MATSKMLIRPYVLKFLTELFSTVMGTQYLYMWKMILQILYSRNVELFIKICNGCLY